MVKQAEQVGAVLTAQAPHTGHKLAATGRQFVPLVQRVIIQTTRRIIQGEVVPAPEKGVSLFEPHTAVIRKGKPGKPTDFGRVIRYHGPDGMERWVGWGVITHNLRVMAQATVR